VLPPVEHYVFTPIQRLPLEYAVYSSLKLVPVYVMHPPAFFVWFISFFNFIDLYAVAISESYVSPFPTEKKLQIGLISHVLGLKIFGKLPCIWNLN